ncbi:MAG: hypothetical protein V4603_08875 [Pseudomonadota bacterium]
MGDEFEERKVASESMSDNLAERLKKYDSAKHGGEVMVAEFIGSERLNPGVSRPDTSTS